MKTFGNLKFEIKMVKLTLKEDVAYEAWTCLLNGMSFVRQVLDIDTHTTIVQYILVKCPIQKTFFWVSNHCKKRTNTIIF